MVVLLKCVQHGHSAPIHGAVVSLYRRNNARHQSATVMVFPKGLLRSCEVSLYTNGVVMSLYRRNNDMAVAVG